MVGIETSGSYDRYFTGSGSFGLSNLHDPLMVQPLNYELNLTLNQQLTLNDITNIDEFFNDIESDGGGKVRIL